MFNEDDSSSSSNSRLRSDIYEVLRSVERLCSKGKQPKRVLTRA